MKKLDSVLKSAKSLAYSVKFKAMKHSPEILVGSGIIGGVTAAVLACRATTKIEIVEEEYKENIQRIDSFVERNGYSEKYTEEDEANDKRTYTIQKYAGIVRLYIPSVLLGAASIGAILKGHNILSTRNAAITAAYAAVDKGFKEYRQRVVEQFGDDIDRQLRFGTKTEKKTITEVDENGNEVEKEVEVETVDPNNYSMFAKFFDSSSRNWLNSAEMNLDFLWKQQCWANKVLKDRGFLTLNEVYDMLDIERTKAGMVVGWVYDEKHPVGDNYVDFGVFNKDDPNARRFVNGLEPVILLDFNVDGNIYELMN